MGDKIFNLTWNNHLANLSGLFEGLYKSGSLTDTTLACQGGMLRAHRLVLAACSPYFERVFKEHHGDQPILILKGVFVEEMECLLDFMYRGSVNVAEEHLPSLIKTATDLEIRGLSGDNRNEINNLYSRVETRLQTCQIETRLRPVDYRKTESVSFLSKQTNGNSIQGGVKLEEIEVEDDPMVMEGHEDSYEEPLQLNREQIKHVPPPMFIRNNSKTEGLKRNSGGRLIHENNTKTDNVFGETPNAESFNTEISIENIKIEPGFNNHLDPTVPAIQMNEDSTDQGKLTMTLQINDTQPKIKDVRSEADSGKKVNNNQMKSGQQKDKIQYKPFACDFEDCTLAFTRASHLARHRRVHTGERPFACTLCPRMFARQDKLKQHLDSHLQWPKKKAFAGLADNNQQSSSLVIRGKRGRPKKLSYDQSTMDEILKFGEFSASMLNKSQPMYSSNKLS